LFVIYTENNAQNITILTKSAKNWDSYQIYSNSCVSYWKLWSLQ